jgi:hypothetical protein
LSVPSFGQSKTTKQLFRQAQSAGMTNTIADFSRFVFSIDFTPPQGLGPLFNAQSCVGCHAHPTAGGMGLDPDETAQFVGRLRFDGTFDPLVNHGGPVARVHSVAELGVPCALPTGVPSEANVVSLRNAMTLRGIRIFCRTGAWASSAGKRTSPRWSSSGAMRSGTKSG